MASKPHFHDFPEYHKIMKSPVFLHKKLSKRKLPWRNEFLEKSQKFSWNKFDRTSLPRKPNIFVIYQKFFSWKFFLQQNISHGWISKIISKNFQTSIPWKFLIPKESTLTFFQNTFHKNFPNETIKTHFFTAKTDHSHFFQN